MVVLTLADAYAPPEKENTSSWRLLPKTLSPWVSSGTREVGLLASYLRETEAGGLLALSLLPCASGAPQGAGGVLPISLQRRSISNTNIPHPRQSRDRLHHWPSCHTTGP